MTSNPRSLLKGSIGSSIRNDPYPQFKLFTFVSVLTKMLSKDNRVCRAPDRRIEEALDVSLEVFGVSHPQYIEIGKKFVLFMDSLERQDGYCSRTREECEELLIKAVKECGELYKKTAEA
jgi:hypothetical protein